MSINNIFGIAGSAMNAQLVRMNAGASNMANSSTVAGSPENAYKAKRPVFEALLAEQQTNERSPTVGGVKISEVALEIHLTTRCLIQVTPMLMKMEWCTYLTLMK